MNPSKHRHFPLICLTSMILLCGCPQPFWDCQLALPHLSQTYTFDCSKEELKNRLVEAYTYDQPLWRKNLGLTLLQSKEVNEQYRNSLENWLDRGNWKRFELEILEHTSDTIELLIGKHHSIQELRLTAILQGDHSQSSLTISDATFRRRKACSNKSSRLEGRLSKRFAKALIEKLR